MLQQAEYPGAIAVPTTNYFPKRNGYVGPLTIVEHGTAGFPTAIAVALYFQSGPVSAHFVIGRDGTVYQCVSIYDACWGEGGNSSNLPFWPKGVNGNFFTFGIEHHKISTSNGDDLTEAQYIASGKLNRWLCEKFSIPKRIIVDSAGGLTGHGVLDPSNRSAVNGPGGCPGTFDWVKLARLVNTSKVPLNHLGEVANFVTPTQFEYNETWYGCGYVAAAEFHFMKPATVINTSQPEDADVWADTQYKKENGGIGTDQTNGVSIDDMHRMILLGGHDYFDIPAINPNSVSSHDVALLIAILEQGYSLALTILERTVYDLLLKKNPYYWITPTTNATHVTIGSGIGPYGELLMRDSANVSGDIYGVNQIRPQPRPYDINKLGIQWACVVIGDHLPIPPKNWDPLTQVINPPVVPIIIPPIEDVMPTLKHVHNPTPGQVQQATTMWQRYTLPKKDPTDPTEPPQYLPYDTDIALNWQQACYNGLAMGPPNGPETDEEDWNSKPIKRQSFDGGWCEHNGYVTTMFIYGCGELKYSD